MKDYKNHSAKKGIAFILVLAVVLSMVPAVPAYAGVGSNLDDSTGWKVATPMNGQFDYLTDQQTAAGQAVSQDIVGSNSYPAFYTQFDPATNDIGFRFRLNFRDGQNDQQLAYKKFAFVGIDAADANGKFDGGIDFFVGIYNVKNGTNTGRIGIYNSKPGVSNSSPNTTGIDRLLVAKVPSGDDIAPPIKHWITLTHTSYTLSRNSS